jgi:hypothetical protein
MATDEHGQVGEVNAQDIQQVCGSDPRTYRTFLELVDMMTKGHAISGAGEHRNTIPDS